MEKSELLNWLQEEVQQWEAFLDQMGPTRIEALTDETAQRRCRFDWGEVSFVELQLYTMRHS